MKSMDRLSELPDLLIHHILGFLPTNDVVRTMVLSKQWKTLWSSTTSLTFNDSMVPVSGSNSTIRTERFRSFVYGVLTLWKGCKLETFRVILVFHYDESLHRDIRLWVRWALDRGVEHLYLDLSYPVDEVKRKHHVFWSPPQCLYSCSSLRQLSIFGCNLQINGNVDVEWRNLKELYIEGCGLTQSLINQVLAGSPKLDVLLLTLFQCNEISLSIQSTSLRHLLLDKCMWRGDDINIPLPLDLDSELRIVCAPNLETLKLYGLPYSKCSLMNVSSLTNVALRFCTDNRNFDFLGETLAQILPAIQHVEQLRLSDCCIMALGAMEIKNMLANVKLLKLNNYGFQEYQEIARLLANVPKLEMLALQPVYNKYSRSCKHKVVETKRLEITNLPYSSLQQLRRVRVTWTGAVDDSIFPFIEILLKCASNLQKLEFGVRELPNSSFLAAQTRLLGMPRSSPSTAQLICYECKYEPTFLFY